ncbi:mitochondrial protein [Cryptococcus bacillisporus CA1873]|uniref:Mitochondrial protein n=1 Tax=Cryptococcus bacillisporus CA1873 TaxID=1296111 RepID=A0ABR5BH40_CRYGA|nr:mitochondrial protein [Cryptococcus bacillisporus CA1873]|eukprot:KIR68502.1 mitochondrial protein [Cryptococcus gattii CA1873]
MSGSYSPQKDLQRPTQQQQFPPKPPCPSSSVWSGNLGENPVFIGIGSAVGASALTLLGVMGYRRYWKRIKNADYVTSELLRRRAWIKGIVTSVGDGDNLRLYHTPGPFFRYPFKIRSIPTTQKGLRNETISIRIAGVDAPENAHFGNPAQPHAKESLEWLRATVLGKRMRCQLLAKDQYNRIVAVPYISRRLWWDRPLPLMMLKEGMAVVYKAGGAEYGPWGLDEMLKVEAEARYAKRGLWALRKFESPGDFKARMKLESDVSEERPEKKSPSGWIALVKRLIKRT